MYHYIPSKWQENLCCVLKLDSLKWETSHQMSLASMAPCVMSFYHIHLSWVPSSLSLLFDLFNCVLSDSNWLSPGKWVWIHNGGLWYAAQKCHNTWWCLCHKTCFATFSDILFCQLGTLEIQQGWHYEPGNLYGQTVYQEISVEVMEKPQHNEFFILHLSLRGPSSTVNVAAVNTKHKESCLTEQRSIIR